jgi:hypothetical protein
VGQPGVRPILGEWAGHQPVLGFDYAIVAGGPFGFIGGPLQALVPQRVQGLPLLRQVRGRLQREAQRRWCERGADPLTDDGVDGCPWEIWALGPSIIRGQPTARVTRQSAGAPRAHLPAAAP